MNKNKYLLYLLLCGLMLYYAVPKFSLESIGVDSLFAGTWLLFALLVAAGNLSAFLYTPKKQKAVRTSGGNDQKRERGFGG